ncbi:MAG: hypothetical protein ACK5Q1_10215 [Limnobacter sp.]|jgi:hypothetical protein
MADYIRREVLCEAYTHLDIKNFSDANSREALEKQIREFIIPRAEFIFGEEVELQITFDDGSLKTKIAMLGAVAGLITAYPDFKSGIDNLSRDAIVLAQAANLEVVFKTRTASCDRIRIEKRSGVLGRVNHLISTSEKIRDNAGHSRIPTANELKEVTENVDALQRWFSDTESLMQKLESNDTKACVAAGLLEELERFPEELPWVAQTRKDNFKARLLIEDVELATSLDAVAARYARLLAIAKIHLQREVEIHAPKNA